MGLSLHERELLIDCARSAVKEFLEQGVLEDSPSRLPNPPPALREERGLFVTVYRSGRLRGCMGTAVAVLPLWQACRVCARNAAYKDPRFLPLSVEDLPHTSFEIAVLGASRPFVDTSQIQGGGCGLILRKGYRQEVVLPGMLGDMPTDMDGLMRLVRDRVEIDADGADAPETWTVVDLEVVSERDL